MGTGVLVQAPASPPLYIIVDGSEDGVPPEPVLVSGLRVTPLRVLADLALLSPGIILIDPKRDESAKTWARTCQAVIEAGPEWRVAIVDVDAPTVVRTLSLGPALQIAELSGDTSPAGGPRRFGMVDLRAAYLRVAEARHTLNNQLSVALAETHLLQMDSVDELAQRSCEAILLQLRKMRDTIQSQLSFASEARWLNQP